MVHQFFALLPAEGNISTGTIVTLIVTAAAGAVMWLAGARFSRPTITLLTVLLGASIGLRMPEWFGWTISGAGPAVAAALLLGVTGYVVHGGYTGALFGLTLALWGALGVWMVAGGGEAMTWPTTAAHTSLAVFATAWWHGLPPDVARLLPYTTGTALVSGLACAVLWARLTTILAWSTTGATMLLGGALAAMHVARPHWLEGRLPSGTAAQVALVLFIVLVGALVQWKLVAPKTPQRAEKNPSSSSRRKRSESPVAAEAA